MKDQLIHGAAYWLGATYGEYSEQYDAFFVGNSFVPRSNTVFAD
jgi:hypothetical protein